MSVLWNANDIQSFYEPGKCCIIDTISETRTVVVLSKVQDRDLEYDRQIKPMYLEWLCGISSANLNAVIRLEFGNALVRRK